MGWDRGRYYTRSRKVNGRVVREYVGTGETAQLIAQLDEIERDKLDCEREAKKAAQAELDSLDKMLDNLDELTELVARTALVAAGFRQHKRGEWRKRREQHDSSKAD